MRAIQVIRPGLIRAVELPRPVPGPGQLLVRVHACGVCRTDLHILDGEVEIPRPPVVPGHQIVGTVIEAPDDGGGGGEAGAGERGEAGEGGAGEARAGEPGGAEAGPGGAEAGRLGVGARVGIPWVGWTCGRCRYCLTGRENLCVAARFTGRDIDGGFAQFTVADRRYCFELPDGYDDLAVAPLLCAGLIGYRALRLAGDGERVGLYGFGAAAHIIAQVAAHQGRRVFAFTRPGDDRTQAFARTVGAEWAGGSDVRPPEELDAAIIFAAAGELVPVALGALARGGVVVCAGIHMSEIPAFPYDILWGERAVRSVANLTRADAAEFLALARRFRIETVVAPYALSAVPQALEDLRAGRFAGAAVVDVAGSAA
jgi:propanol-preferring alcohol dehydrogenase